MVENFVLFGGICTHDDCLCNKSESHNAFLYVVLPDQKETWDVFRRYLLLALTLSWVLSNEMP